MYLVVIVDLGIFGYSSSTLHHTDSIVIVSIDSGVNSKGKLSELSRTE